MKDIVQDKFGNAIYLTDERWQHIIKRHPVLKNLKNEVLKTIRVGKREQELFYPNKFLYQKACMSLRHRYTHIKSLWYSKPKTINPIISWPRRIQRL